MCALADAGPFPAARGPSADLYVAYPPSTLLRYQAPVRGWVRVAATENSPGRASQKAQTRCTGYRSVPTGSLLVSASQGYTESSDTAIAGPCI
jgi:hypothetical protein